MLGPQPLLPQGLAPRKSLLNMCGVMNSAWQPDKAGRRPSSSPPGPDPIESIFPSLLSIRSPWPTHHWSGQSQWPGLKETGRSEGVKWPGWGMEGGGDAESQNQRPAHWRRWEWAVHGMAEKLPWATTSVSLEQRHVHTWAWSVQFAHVPKADRQAGGGVSAPTPP